MNALKFVAIPLVVIFCLAVEQKPEWAGLKALVRIESTRLIGDSGLYLTGNYSNLKSLLKFSVLCCAIC